MFEGHEPGVEPDIGAELDCLVSKGWLQSVLCDRRQSMVCGNFNTMMSTMDRAGRIVIPKVARERARLRPGVPLDIRVVDGRIEIEPAAARVVLEQRSGFWVAVHPEAPPPLTQHEVDQTTNALRAPLQKVVAAED